jgi:hypothetical protein
MEYLMIQNILDISTLADCLIPPPVLPHHVDNNMETGALHAPILKLSHTSLANVVRQAQGQMLIVRFPHPKPKQRMEHHYHPLVLVKINYLPNHPPYLK